MRQILASAIMACAAIAASADASSIMVVGNPDGSTEGLGNFTGLIEYESSLFSTVGVLTVSLTNTSATLGGGYITGFLFNIGGADTGASATLQPAAISAYPFKNCGLSGRSGVPYGTPYDAGAALGGKFLGGGNPTRGIGFGETGVFRFNVSASDAGSLTAEDFVSAGRFEDDFIVRFRGFTNGDSDKVPGLPVEIIPLPAPVAMGMAGLALVGCVSRRWRRG
jgi:hypothetical protein